MVPAFWACNSKDDSDSSSYVANSSVAITKMTLSADDSVAEDLDSVFFSIDLENAVVFNADSLPVGTDVSKLVPVISYASSVNSAVITMTGGKVREGEVDYYKNPTDSIDFTGRVEIKLTASQGSSRTYRLKVNVHNVDPDSLSWGGQALSSLPSRKPNPTAQKTVRKGDLAACLVREADASLTLALNKAPLTDAWSKYEIADPGIDIASFTASDDAFFALSADGTLMRSVDAREWEPVASGWVSITGGFGNAVLGVRSDGSALKHVSYPASYPESDLEDNFPVRGASNMGILTNKWSPEPIGIIVGGYNVYGDPVNATWGFDGDVWAVLSEDGPASIAEGCLIPYYYYHINPGNVQGTEYPVWIFMGGVDAEGANDRTVWLSYDNCVRWKKAPDSLQLPDYLPAVRRADAIVLTTPMSANLTDAWTRRGKPARLPYELDGTVINWDCPWIFLFGGYGPDGDFSDKIWCGVLNRLSFTPIF